MKLVPLGSSFNPPTLDNLEVKWFDSSTIHYLPLVVPTRPTVAFGNTSNLSKIRQRFRVHSPFAHFQIQLRCKHKVLSVLATLFTPNYNQSHLPNKSLDFFYPITTDLTVDSILARHHLHTVWLSDSTSIIQLFFPHNVLFLLLAAGWITTPLRCHQSPCPMARSYRAHSPIQLSTSL